MYVSLICVKYVIIILANTVREAVAIEFTKYPGREIPGSIYRTIREKEKIVRLDRYYRLS
jgi:hypothetical protein